MNALRILGPHRPAPDDPAIIRAMAPADFLRLALPLDMDDEDRADFTPDWIADWDDWPFLMIDPATGQVHGHEGRHRVDAAHRAGFTSIDVIWYLTPDPSGMSEKDALAWQWDGQVPGALIPEAAWREGLQARAGQ